MIITEGREGYLTLASSLNLTWSLKASDCSKGKCVSLFLSYFYPVSISIYLRKMKLLHIVHATEMRLCGNHCKKCPIQLSTERINCSNNNSQCLARSNVIGTISHIIRLNADWITFCHCLDKLWFNLVMAIKRSICMDKHHHKFKFSWRRKTETNNLRNWLVFSLALYCYPVCCPAPKLSNNILKVNKQKKTTNAGRFSHFCQSYCSYFHRDSIVWIFIYKVKKTFV